MPLVSYILDPHFHARPLTNTDTSLAVCPEPTSYFQDAGVGGNVGNQGRKYGVELLQGLVVGSLVGDGGGSGMVLEGKEGRGGEG